jgi:hypothetical protein
MRLQLHDGKAGAFGMYPKFRSVLDTEAATRERWNLMLLR